MPHSEYWDAFEKIVASVGGRPHWAKVSSVNCFLKRLFLILNSHRIFTLSLNVVSLIIYISRCKLTEFYGYNLMPKCVDIYIKERKKRGIDRLDF